jgi:hypothetical protein
MGPSAGLDDVEKRKLLTLLELELRPLGRPARSQSLYRLRTNVFILSICCNTAATKLYITNNNLAYLLEARIVKPADTAVSR